MASKTPQFAKLSSHNYPQWSDEMKAWLRSQSLWRIVSGDIIRPLAADPTAPTATEIALIDAWIDKLDRASGWIFLMVEPEQRVHITSIQDDATLMWKKLEDVHRVKKAGARFNAYDDLFSIRKKEDEELQSLVNRVDAAMQTI
jgi:hypothetical protein